MDALNSIIAPVRPTLRSITQALPVPVQDASQALLGPACHKTIVLDWDLSAGNAACVKLAVSKALGVGIITLSGVVKVPQILKLVRAQSAEGVSFLATALETASFTTTLAYSVRHGFPFSTYGETAFISVQNAVLAVLILVFSGQAPRAAAFVAALAAAVYALFAPGSSIVDMHTLGLLQAAAGNVGLLAKIPQIWTIYQAGTTGQLSAFAVFTYLGGSLARVFTTLQEVDDKLILYGYIGGAALNAILAAQMVYYWNAPSATTSTAAAAKKKKKQQQQGSTPASITAQRQEMAVGVSSAAATPKSAAKGPSTRRRG